MKDNLRLFLILGMGAVIGSILNELLAATNAPLWLVNTLEMGIDPPFTLNLIVFQLTIGLAIRMSLASVCGMLLALLVFHKRL